MARANQHRDCARVLMQPSVTVIRLQCRQLLLLLLLRYELMRLSHPPAASALQIGHLQVPRCCRRPMQSGRYCNRLTTTTWTVDVAAASTRSSFSFSFRLLMLRPVPSRPISARSLLHHFVPETLTALPAGHSRAMQREESPADQNNNTCHA